MSEMQLVAAFCSHQAWSVRISSSERAARSTHRGSVGSCRPRMFFWPEDGVVWPEVESIGRNYAIRGLLATQRFDGIGRRGPDRPDTEGKQRHEGHSDAPCQEDPPVERGAVGEIV